MQTIEYKLKSHPEISVRVPADYANEAESLVKLAVEDPRILAISVPEYPCLRNPGIMAGTASLVSARPGTPESLKLQDEVYLRVCIYGNEKKMRGPEREEAIEIDRALIRLVENL